ncbi:MAG: BON domain-containing protein [Chloroflexi bacterium]|nr:BON domain-containing protein [Chloroflexota bacterium]MDA1240126.1 BON domain-containing protein [Chloroflexota bacterium]
MTQQTMGANKGAGNPLANLWSMVQTFRGGDAGLTARASRRVRKALGDDAANIMVDAISGSVTLRGSVKSKELSQAAAEAVRGTRGAAGVLNFLEVR